ncbi:MAG TPA: SRPBCC domain-containing protein [Bacteroidia bacterium]|nr:SRPBCC domain-containing protein [Bacteroidia bacterium]
MYTKNQIIESSLQIQKKAEIIFDAIVDPNNMKNYFISESNGRMESGRTLQWKFPEFDEQFEVRVKEIESPSFISFEWDEKDKAYRVEIKIKPFDDQSCVVHISESSCDDESIDIEKIKRNTGGWANFLACMKAYIEFGINLRKGSFDYYKGKI